ncbi:MAG: RdgB/HAM1 family non-canonical purine NTP pyrophosphatase [Bacteroidetes bacterium]|nr:MAG: RdgB/HAM1 family non-canonical purine NTP pyrophosphatase [Bacteroidota bacterium]
MKIYLASRNAHKISEIKNALPADITFLSLDDIPCEEELPETGETIPENSLQKAQYIWDNYQVNSLSDDSGLEIEALGGKPGVHSAHYAGSRDFDQNMAKVLQEMATATNRKAVFKTVMTLIIAGEAHQFEGIVEGEILHEKHGEKGFGYDPIFLPTGYDKTFAQMTTEEKNSISHRSRALAKVVAFLKSR